MPRHPEKINPKLVEEWEEKLSKEGLPSMREDGQHIKQEMVPLEHPTEYNREAITSDVLLDFSDLPEEFRKNILDEVKKLKYSGAKISEIVDRTKLLIRGAQELLNLPNSQDPDTAIEAKPEKEIKNIDDFIARMEKISRQENQRNPSAVH